MTKNIFGRLFRSHEHVSVGPLGQCYIALIFQGQTAGSISLAIAAARGVPFCHGLCLLHLHKALPGPTSDSYLTFSR